MSLGLIFIESLDPISQIAKRVSRQLYSTIGIYYTNYLLETPAIEVFIPKVYGSDDPIFKSTSLDYYKKHPLIKQIGLRSINDIYKKDFLTSFAVLRSTVTSSTKEELLDLFMGIGSETSISYKNTGVGFINNIIKKMGMSDKFAKSNASSLDYDDDLSSNSDIVIEYMKSFKSQTPIGTSNFLLCSYLLDNEVFAPLVTVELEAKDPEIVKKSSDVIVQKTYGFVSAITETFITKMSNNSVYNYEFVKIVTNSFKHVREEQKRIKILLEVAVDKLSSNGHNLLKERRISWDELVQSITDTNSASDILSLLTGREFKIDEHMTKPPLSFDVRVDVDSKQTPNQIFLNSISDLINDTHDNFNKSKVSEVHWGELIADINMLLVNVGMPALDIPNIKPIEAMITFDPSSKLNLELVTGKHITIRNQIGDEKELDGLSPEELHNLNAILDVIAGNDHRFDNIRTYVTRLLSKK